MKVDLTTAQRERLLDLLWEQLQGVRTGSITGYGQPMTDEVANIEELITELEG